MVPEPNESAPGHNVLMSPLHFAHGLIDQSHALRYNDNLGEALPSTLRLQDTMEALEGVWKA